MATSTWTTNLYNLAGTQLASLTELSDRQFIDPLNGMDQMNLGMYLDDPSATLIQPLTTVVKMWRNVNDPLNGKTWTQPAGQPTFCGIVGYVNKDGAGNKMTFQCYSPMWRLKFRFHLLNHRLVKNNLVADVNYGNPWDQSELMWKLIDLTNGAFGSASHTQIYKGNWVRPTIIVSPYYVAQGSNVWSNLVDDLLARVGGTDISPRYIHTAGTPNLMWFDTAYPRGTDRSATVSLDYHTGLTNIDNMTELQQMQPDQFGNYDWVVGQGDENSNKIGVAFDATGNPYSYGTIGVYMARSTAFEAKTSQAAANIADEFIKLSRVPAKGYSVSLAPMTPPYYKTDLNTGDLVRLNASRGGLTVSAAKQRIVQIAITMSENNVESTDLLLTGDLKGRFAA